MENRGVKHEFYKGNESAGPLLRRNKVRRQGDFEKQKTRRQKRFCIIIIMMMMILKKEQVLHGLSSKL